MLKKLALCVPLAMLALAGCSSSDNRFAPAETLEINNVITLNELWSTSTGGVDDFFSELEPAFDAQSIYHASRKGEVVALSQANGEKIWEVDLSKEVENDDKRSARLAGGVAIFNNLIAIGSENGYIYVLNTQDGSLVWKKYLGAEIIAKPAFSRNGDKLFILDSRGNFGAYDSANGDNLWLTGDAPQSLRLRAQSSPVVIGDDFVLVGTSSGKVNVLLQNSGVTVNQINVGQAVGTNDLERISDVAASPLVLGNILYATSFAGGLVEYDFGLFNYRSRLGYQSSSNLGFDSDSIVLTSDDGSIYCLNRADNSERWVNTQLAYRNVTGPVVYGNYAVVGDYEGYVYLLDMADGSIDYMEKIDSSGLYVPAQVKDGKLYLVARDGTLACLSFADTSTAKAVELANNNELATAAQNITLNHPGVYDGGIYIPNSISPEKLEERRAAIKKAVAQQEAQMAKQLRMAREAQRARAEYEAKRKAYEEERRQRLSGFGIASGIRSEIDEYDEEQAQDTTEQSEE